MLARRGGERRSLSEPEWPVTRPGAGRWAGGHRSARAVIELPAGVALVRTTAEFDERSVPRGLLRAHRVAAGVWGRLVVHGGSLTFGFDDEADSERVVEAGTSQVIPPARTHHVTIVGPVRFVVEFYEPPLP